MDNVNFADTTLWESGHLDASPFRTEIGVLGTQYVRAATNLADIGSAEYDFVASSHVLEHLANPLAGLREWRSVTKPGGQLLIILPHRSGTFDHRRPITTLAHVKQDEQDNAQEEDTTHFAEVLALHDRRRDPSAGDQRAFEERVQSNATIRGVHHHVFDAQLAVEVVSEAGWSVREVEARRPYDIIVWAERLPSSDRTLKSPTLLLGSPFRLDRQFMSRAHACD